mgnify:CR=1 FL=1|jgi:zinc finger domain, LSD1 subclass subfamily
MLCYVGTKCISATYSLEPEKQEQAARAAEKKEARWNTENLGSAWDEAETANMMIQTCSSCGAELVSDGNTMATSTKSEYCRWLM